jgi:hypothetical protein
MKMKMKTPNQEKNCYANYHLTVAEYGLWEHSRTISFKRGRLLFDGRKMSARFSGTGKNAFYRLAAQLVKKGWFEIIDDNVTKSGKRKRDSHGHYLPTVYGVLNHEEWVNKHGFKACRHVEIDEEVQSPDQDTSSPQIGTRPVPETGHKSVAEPSDGKPSDANLIKDPVLKTGQVSKREDPRGSLNVQRNPVPPVPKVGQGVPGTRYSPEDIKLARDIDAGRLKPMGLNTHSWVKEVLAAQEGRNAV